MRHQSRLVKLHFANTVLEKTKNKLLEMVEILEVEEEDYPTGMDGGPNLSDVSAAILKLSRRHMTAMKIRKRKRGRLGGG